MPSMEMRYKIGINAPLVRREAKTAMVEGDRCANTIVIEVTDGLEPADLAGCSVSAIMKRSDGARPFVRGKVEGNVVTVCLNESFYAVPGNYELLVRLTHTDGTKRVILWLHGWINDEGQGDLIDTENAVPDLEDLLAQIDAMEKATANATAAAETANAAAAEAVNIATTKGDEAVQIATGMTKSLIGLPVECEASGPLVTVTDAAAQPALQLITHIEPVQEGEGNPSPENVRAISGWDQVSLTNDTSGQTLTTDLPETVYGGTLDWCTGVLTVDSAVMAFDGTEGDWVVNTSLSNTVRRRPSTGISSVTMCSHYRARSVSVSSNDMSVSSGQYLNFRDSIRAVNVDTWTAYLVEQAAAGTPVTIVYALANPYTIQLTPQQLDMLKGTNNVWSDTGDTDLVYVADTKLYIDGKFAELEAAILSIGSNV